jgi:putative transposase
VINLIASEKICLFPTASQEGFFKKCSGVARFSYNNCLNYKITEYQSNNHTCSVQELIDHIKELKYSDDYSWINEVPEIVTKQAIKDLDSAYKSFFKGQSNFPKYKKKGKCRESFATRADRFSQPDETHIKLVGLKESIRIKPHVIIDRLLNPRISFDGKFWYLSYSYEVECHPKSESQEAIGVDLGIKVLAQASNKTEPYPNINKSKHIRQLEKRKRRLQRQLSRKYYMNKTDKSNKAYIKGEKQSKTHNIIKLEQKIRLIDRQLKNIRNTYIHEVTSDIVKTKPCRIVIEDLNVSGMMKNKHLAKAIQQQEWYKFRQYLTYKCIFFGIELVVADRYYASSKRCSCCGHIKKNLKLSDRVYNCFNCGLTIDRDLNASMNLQNYKIA